MMANEFRVCDRCKAVNSRSLVGKLNKLDPGAQIKVGCQSYCGIGFKKTFAIVNGMHVTAKDEDELMQKIKRFLK
jgi:uncharacterized protein YuzB (UPF0349 family)